MSTCNTVGMISYSHSWRKFSLLKLGSIFVISANVLAISDCEKTSSNKRKVEKKKKNDTVRSWQKTRTRLGVCGTTGHCGAMRTLYNDVDTVKQCTTTRTLTEYIAKFVSHSSCRSYKQVVAFIIFHF